MKKITVVITCLLLATAGFAQKDSARSQKQDTVEIPVYINEVTDTVAVDILLHKGPNGTVLYTAPGYLIVRGTAATRQGSKESTWIKSPVVIGALDQTRKRKIDPIIPK